MTLIIILFLIFHFFINQLQYVINRNIVFYFLGFITICVIVFFLVQITYTADYEMYENFYKWEYDKTDPLFFNLAIYFKDKDYGFQNLFSTHMIIISVLYSYFILKFNRNLFYVFGVFVILLFIPYVNQIRFFLAFPCFLLASYYLLYNRKIPYFIFFIILGTISHSAIIVLYAFFPFFLYIKEKYYNKIFIFGSVLLFIVSYLVSSSSLHSLLEHFGEYIKNENQSTFLGGVFSTLPTLVILVPLYLLDKNFLGDKTDRTYLFLKKLSFFTVVLLPASIFVQIIGFRYVQPFIVVWLIFFLYLIKDKSLSAKTTYFLVGYFLIGISLYFQYGLPLEVFGESAYLEELTETIESIKN